MNATVWSLYPQREKIPFKFKRLLQGFVWLLVGTFSMGMVSLFIASYFYIPTAIKVIDKIIAGLS